MVEGRGEGIERIVILEYEESMRPVAVVLGRPVSLRGLAAWCLGIVMLAAGIGLPELGALRLPLIVGGICMLGVVATRPRAVPLDAQLWYAIEVLFVRRFELPKVEKREPPKVVEGYVRPGNVVEVVRRLDLPDGAVLRVLIEGQDTGERVVVRGGVARIVFRAVPRPPFSAIVTLVDEAGNVVDRFVVRVRGGER